MTLITDPQALAAFCKDLSGADYITVDTEFMREGTFWPHLCLVQLAGPEGAAAVDPLAEGMDLAPLHALLDDERILKVMHAARQDVEIFYHDTGIVPSPLFDTQVAAMVCGFGDQVGYETLVAKLAKKRLDKASRFTDWARRPLSDEQIEYALGDVTHLRVVYEKLRVQIEAADRVDWIDEEMAVLCDPATYAVVPADAWRRLKPKRNDPRYLAVLAAIAAWREETAMERDMPRNRVLRDDILVQLATRPPENAAALSRVRGIPRGFAEGRMGKGLIEAIEAGLATPPSEAPVLPDTLELPRGAGPLVDLLKVLLKFKCETHDVAQKLVASVADLEAIAASDSAAVPALHGWRLDVFGADALRLKHGELALSAGRRSLRLVPLDGAAPEESASDDEASAARDRAADGGADGARSRRRRRGGRGRKRREEADRAGNATD